MAAPYYHTISLVTFDEYLNFRTAIFIYRLYHNFFTLATAWFFIYFLSHAKSKGEKKKINAPENCRTPLPIKKVVTEQQDSGRKIQQYRLVEIT